MSGDRSTLPMREKTLSDLVRRNTRTTAKPKGMLSVHDETWTAGGPSCLISAESIYPEARSEQMPLSAPCHGLNEVVIQFFADYAAEPREKNASTAIESEMLNSVMRSSLPWSVDNAILVAAQSQNVRELDEYGWTRRKARIRRLIRWLSGLEDAYSR